jgi:hypothetical protein
MYKQKQQFLHTDDQKGDCFRAALANLLELDINSVPHFVQEAVGPRDFLIRVNRFLKQYNLAYQYLSVSELEHTGIEGLYHIGNGSTNRQTLHSVCCKDTETIFDPHPSNGGLESMSSIGCFMVLDPSKLTKKSKIISEFQYAQIW